MGHVDVPSYGFLCCNTTVDDRSCGEFGGSAVLVYCLPPVEVIHNFPASRELAHILSSSLATNPSVFDSNGILYP